MSRDREQADAPHRVILVGDPDWDTRTILLRALEHAGFEVHTADSGDALLDAASDGPDLIVAEIYQRCRSGRCSVQCMKHDPLLRRIPILVYTSRVLPSDAQWARDIGAEGYLTKPARIQTLVHAVNMLLAAARENRGPANPLDLPPHRPGEDTPSA